MHTIITDILEYVIVPVFPYFNSLAIQRILLQDMTAEKSSRWHGHTGLELMNILSAGKLLYAVGHFADAAISQLFLTAFVFEVSMLFWLAVQMKESKGAVAEAAKAPLYLSFVYFVTLLVLLFYASHGR